jgi:hypothetical protein
MDTFVDQHINKVNALADLVRRFTGTEDKKKKSQFRKLENRH